MKKLLVGMVFLSTVVLCAWSSGQIDGRNVLLIVRDFSPDMAYMLEKEVGPMTQMLRDGGYRVVIASDSGKPIAAANLTLTVDTRLSRVHVTDDAGVIIPCLAAGDAPANIRVPQSAVKLVKEAVEAGIPVAAQNSGVEILAKADVMKGRQFAIDQFYSGLVPGGVFKGTGVIQDGKVITSGTCPYLARETGRPDGTVDLTRKLIETMAASE